MAKRVKFLEEDLAKGLKGIGNPLAGISTWVQRDNPFRDSRQEKVEPPKTIEVRLPPPEPQVAKPTTPNIAPEEPKSVRALPVTPKPRSKVREGGKRIPSGGVGPESGRLYRTCDAPNQP